MSPFVLWLGTLNDGKAKSSGHRTDYVFLNQAAARHQTVKSGLRKYEDQEDLPPGRSDSLLGTGDQIIALAMVEPCQQHHALVALDEDMQCQYDVFRYFAAEDIDGRLYYLRVLKVERLPAPVAVTLASERTRGRCLSFVRSEWAKVFFSVECLGIPSAELSWWKEQTGGQAPTVLLRTLKAFAFLAVAKIWKCIAVPDFTASGVSIIAGWSSVVTRRRQSRESLEDLLFLRNAFLTGRDLAQKRMLETAALPSPTLASTAGQSFLQSTLRSLGEFLQGGRPVADWESMLQQLYSASRIVQAAQDEHVFWQFENEGLSSRCKHSVLKLLDFFFLAQYLHNDGDLRHVLLLAASACMLPSEAEQVKRRLERPDSASTMRVPSAATISRARGRIDAAYMLLYREFLEHRLDRGDRVYVQCDATWQAHREYQICLLNLLNGSNLHDLQKDCCGAAVATLSSFA